MYGTGHVDVSWCRKEEPGEKKKEKFIHQLVLGDMIR
jgi:hypothetical protein